MHLLKLKLRLIKCMMHLIKSMRQPFKRMMLFSTAWLKIIKSLGAIFLNGPPYSVNEKGKFPSQAHIPHRQYMAQGSQDKPNNEHINVVITRSGKTVVTLPVEEQTKNRDNSEEPTINEPVKRPIFVPFPQALKTSRKLDSSLEILENLRQVRINLPLLHVIKQVPSYAKILKDLCTMKMK